MVAQVQLDEVHSNGALALAADAPSSKPALMQPEQPEPQPVDIVSTLEKVRSLPVSSTHSLRPPLSPRVQSLAGDLFSYHGGSDLVPASPFVFFSYSNFGSALWSSLVHASSGVLHTHLRTAPNLSPRAEC